MSEQPTDTQGQQQPDPSNSGRPTSTRVSIPTTAPAGILTINHPPMGTTTFYKIHPMEYITFNWSLSDIHPDALPTSLTIRATGDSKNNNIYTIGENDGTIAGDATSLVWNPYEYNQATPTLKWTPGEYTLAIWDDRGERAARQPGYMQPFIGFKFSLYTPMPFTALESGWTCTGCNSAALRLSTHPLLISLISTILVLALSGFSLLRGGRR